MVNPVISELAAKGVAIRAAQARAQDASRQVAAQLRPARPAAPEHDQAATAAPEGAP